MKKFLILAASLLLSLALASAQQPSHQHQHGGGNEWKEKVKSQRIAALSAEMNLSPEEAQAFWPVYNNGWDRRDAIQGEVMKAFRKLYETEKKGLSDDEISEAFKAYFAAQDKMQAFEKKLYGEYCKVLPAAKVAKLYVAEEKFRREQLQRLGGGPRPQGGQPGGPQGQGFRPQGQPDGRPQAGHGGRSNVPDGAQPRK